MPKVIRYPSHYIVAPKGYCIPKYPYLLDDDRSICAIVEITPKLDFPFEFQLDKDSIVECINKKTIVANEKTDKKQPTYLIERIEKEHPIEYSKVRDILSSLEFEMTEHTITSYYTSRNSDRIFVNENVIKIQHKNPGWFSEAHFFNENGTYSYAEFSMSHYEIIFHPCDDLWSNFVDAVCCSIIMLYGKM